jgi:predicted nucleic acid-binding protein
MLATMLKSITLQRQYVLACAFEAKADYIISRDPQLRNLKHFHCIKIIDDKAFVERVRKG